MMTYGCKIERLQIVSHNAVHPLGKHDNLRIESVFLGLFHNPKIGKKNAPCRCRAISLNVTGSRSM